MLGDTCNYDHRIQTGSLLALLNTVLGYAGQNHASAIIYNAFSFCLQSETKEK